MKNYKQTQISLYLCTLVIGVAILAFFAVIFATNRPARAADGINKQIHFQGKVTNADGTNVADGNYSFVFNLYTVDSGGSAVWTDSETVAVDDGVFQYNLGSDTVNAPLPGSVDFDSDNIYLGITFNNDADGEMVPRIRLTAAPYAFNADKLDGLDASDLVQLSPGSQQTGNINVSGSGTFGNGLTVTSSGLSVTGDSIFTGNGAFTGNLSVDADGSSTASPRTISYTDLTSGEAARFQFADGNTAIQQSFNGRMTMYSYYGIELRGSRQTTAPSFSNGSGSDASVTIYSPTGSRRALVIQGASSQSGDLMQVINSSLQVIYSIKSNGSLQLGSSGNVTGAIIFNNSSTSNTVTMQSGAVDANYTLTLPATGPSTDQCLKSDATTASQLVFGTCGGGGGVTTVGTFSGSSLANGASISDDTITFGPADETNPGMVSTGAQTFGGDKTFSGQTAVTTTSSATNNIIGGLTASFTAAPASASTANYAGILANAASSSGNMSANSVLTGVLGTSVYSGSGTVGYLTAFNGGVLNTSSGTVNNGFGVFIDGAINDGGGTLTNNYGIFVESQTAGVNDYGIYVENADTYALFVDAGDSRFDGFVRVGDSGTNSFAQGDGDLYVENLLEVGGEAFFGDSVVAGINAGYNDAHSLDAVALEVQGAAMRIGDYGSSTTFTNGLGIKFADAGVAHGSFRYLSGDELFQFCDSSSSSTTLECDGVAALSIDVDANSVTIGSEISLDGTTGDAVFGGDGTIQGGSLTLGSASQAGILLISDGSSNAVGLTVSGVGSNYTLTLPAAAPSTGQCLKGGSSSATSLEWGTCGGSSGHVEAVEIAPEYAGAVLMPDGSNNTGMMNSGFCSGSSRKSINTSVCGASDEHHYYEWTTSSGTQDYDIYIRYKIPSNFVSFVSDSTIALSGWRTDATTNSVELALFQANNTQCGSTTNVATGTAAWTTVSLGGSETSCSIAAGDTVIFRVKLTASANDFVRAGTITFSYNASN